MNEAEFIFTGILGCTRAALYLNPGRKLSKEEAARIAGALKRRAVGEPAQYILGKTEFMGLEFEVNPQVLIPRPETEILVEAAVRYALPPQPSVRRLLDIGTGSGCVAISLKRCLPEIEISATDISLEALETARRNAALHGVDVRFFAADLFPASGVFDMIVSNPPYVSRAQMPGLQPEVLKEPANALYGGEDGLDFYRRISSACVDYLVPGGRIIFEVGYGQAEAVKSIILTAGVMSVEETIKDYSGIDRVIVARRKP